MTQILSVLTRNYVVVATDRRLTFVSGSRTGQVAHDDTCKLVSLWGVWGISYTGLARLEGQPTHEWIAIQVAKASCGNASLAAETIADNVTRPYRNARTQIEMSFLIAGWVKDTEEHIEPHYLLVSNMYEDDGSRKSHPDSYFSVVERRLAACRT